NITTLSLQFMQIEPESQTKLLDATLNFEGVLLAGVPGAGGFDAVFAVTLGDSSSNVTKTWSSLNVLALLGVGWGHGLTLGWGRIIGEGKERVLYENGGVTD
ncbi:hypothetical protein HN51_032011, partial [Arachis hypogaea]